MNIRVLVIFLSIPPGALAGQQPTTHGELPDGSLIAFLSDRTGANNIFVIAVDGSGVLRRRRPNHRLERRLVSRRPTHRLHLRRLDRLCRCTW